MSILPLHIPSARLRRLSTGRVGLAAAAAAAALAAFCVSPAATAQAEGENSRGVAAAQALPQMPGGAQVHDATVTTKVKVALVSTSNLSSGDIHVKTQHGKVTLTGSVPDEAQRTQAVNVVKQVDGVQDVRNQLTIRPD